MAWTVLTLIPMPGEVITLGGERPRTPRRGLLALAVLLAALLLASFWSVSQSRRRAVEALVPGRRAALFEQALASARAVCAAGPGLHDECVRQSEFLLEFPECREACRAFANAQLRPPSR